MARSFRIKRLQTFIPYMERKYTKEICQKYKQYGIGLTSSKINYSITFFRLKLFINFLL